jgi:hypothetical protein
MKFDSVRFIRAQNRCFLGILLLEWMEVAADENDNWPFHAGLVR